MKRRLISILALAALALGSLVAGATAGRGPGHGGGHRGKLYVFAGELLAAPGPNATSLSVQVETGNRPALRALIGQSQNQVFAIDSHTEILIYSHGVPHVGSFCFH